MSTFLAHEKQRLELLKASLFSSQACRDGAFKTGRYPFCLHEDQASENLHSTLREDAISYASGRGIPWHSGHDGQPSNHLCSSQVACFNTLFPLTRSPETLAAVFRPFLPQLKEVQEFTADGLLVDGQIPHIAFEWIGSKNYLGERGWGTRGANATSADFAFRFQHYDGRTELVLGEWKYTEQYGTQLVPPEELNARRLATYTELFQRWRERQPNLPPYEAFFSEPFYQLMRLALLAQEMERLGELGADVVSVVHVAPAANTGFAQSITSPALQSYGRTVSAIWTQIAPQGRFVAISAEGLLSVIELAAPPELHGWRDDLLRRYGWWRT